VIAVTVHASRGWAAIMSWRGLVVPDGHRLRLQQCGSVHSYTRIADHGLSDLQSPVSALPEPYQRHEPISGCHGLICPQYLDPLGKQEQGKTN
jgi:hypothetical protein